MIHSTLNRPVPGLYPYTPEQDPALRRMPAEAVAFPLICPMTSARCHSLCVCYRDGRTTTTDAGTAEDMANRTDGGTYGTCAHFGIKIAARRG